MKVAAAHVRPLDTIEVGGMHLRVSVISPWDEGLGYIGRNGVVFMLKDTRGYPIPISALRDPHHHPRDLNVASGWRYFDNTELLEVSR